MLPSGGRTAEGDSWAGCQKLGRDGSEGARRVEGEERQRRSEGRVGGKLFSLKCY